MAKFVEVMRKLRELCRERKHCEGCIMMEGISCGASFGLPCLSEEEIERRVAQWEAAKSKYPSWAQAWKQLVQRPAHGQCRVQNVGKRHCTSMRSIRAGRDRRILDGGIKNDEDA